MTNVNATYQLAAQGLLTVPSDHQHRTRTGHMPAPRTSVIHTEIRT